MTTAAAMSSVGGWTGSAIAVVIGTAVYLAVGLGTLLGIGTLTRSSPPAVPGA